MIDENNVDEKNNNTEQLIIEYEEQLNIEEVETVESEDKPEIVSNKNNLIGKTENSNFASLANLDFVSKLQFWAKRNLDYIVTACSIFVMMIICLAVNGDMPFGKKSFLVSDTYEQVAIFFNQFFDFFEGKSTFFYSNYYAKGIEIFSTMEYMYLNPFYLIVFLGGRSNIYLMITFAVIFMLIFNGLIFVWFARKYFKNVNNLTRIAFALLYSFSGYVNYCIAFSTWIIYPALILIVVDRFINFMKTGKMTSFILTLIWYVIACYSVGISTIIVLILLMILYIFYFEDKQSRAKKLTEFLVVLSVAGLASLIVLFPSIMAVLSTKRSGSFFENLIGTKDASFILKIGVIFLDAIVIILNVYYIIKCNKKSKYNKFLLFTAIIVFMPTLFDSVLKILCFSSYQCFSSRFYFLNEAVIFSVALMVFNQKLLQFKECKTNTLSRFLIGLFIAGIILIVLIVEFSNFSNIGRNLKTARYSKNDLTIIFGSVLLMMLLVLAVGYVLNIRKILSQSAMKKLIVFFISFSLLFNYAALMGSCGENRDSRIEELIVTTNVSGQLKLSANSFNYNNYNIRASELRSSTVFTSLISSETINSYSYFGYYFGKTHVNTKGNTLLADSLLGLDYYLTMKEVDRPYLEFVASIGKYHLYKNKLATNGTFVIDSDFEFDNEISFYRNMENLKDYYGITESLFEEVEITKTVDETINKDYVGYTKVKLEFEAPSNGILYLDREYHDTKNNQGKTEYFVDTNNVYSELDYLTSGENYEISLHIKNKDTNMQDLKCYFLNYDTTKALINKIKTKQPTFNFIKDGYIVEAELQSNENLYIMVPDIDGLHYELNGNEIEINNVFNSMVKISSNEENNTLIVRYKYPHLIKWLLFAIIAIILIAIIVLLYHFTKFNHLQKIIEYCMKGLALLIVFVVYVLGTILSIVWFFV